MPSLADVVREHAPAYLARFGDAMLDSHARALGAITNCRTAALGAELAQCNHCGQSHLFFHSCRNRACPQCGLDTTERWIAKQRQNILPVPYFHVVFTLPAELRRLVRTHQRVLLDVLFVAAFESLSQLAADPNYLGANIGALAVLHTWTRTLEWHPHIHMLVPGGGLGPDGRTWKTVHRPGRKDFLVPIRALAKLFRGRFLHLARRALPNVQFPEIPWGKSWIVYAKRSIKTGDSGPDTLLQYLARYVHRTALTDKRIDACDDKTVTFHYRDSRDGKRKRMQLPGAEFLRRFLQHVPPRGFHRVRAYGLLHPRHRHTLQRLQLLLNAIPADSPPLPTAPAPCAADLNPATDFSAPSASEPSYRRCPHCQSGTLIRIRRLTPLEAATFEVQLKLAATAAARAPP